jgi:hypothetical protein
MKPIAAFPLQNQSNVEGVLLARHADSPFTPWGDPAIYYAEAS